MAKRRSTTKTSIQIEEENEALRFDFRKHLEAEGFEPVRTTRSRGSNRAGRAGPGSGSDEVALLIRDNEGLLRWRLGQPKFSPVGSGRRTSRSGLVDSQVVEQFEFQALEGSQIAQSLSALDLRLTPLAKGHGTNRNSLRQIKNGKFAPPPSPQELKQKKVFLFIHGTFSNCDNTIKDLKRTKSGRAFLATLEAKYDFVLTFDHATLSVSPVLNAYDLAAQLRIDMKQLDIVCHSRGGLVARWYCEAFAEQKMIRRVVFVGSPLAGTSLAAAPKLRNTCDYFSNLAATGSSALGWFPGPITQFVGFQLRLLKWISGAAAKTPLFDAAFAMVPGLDAQSREGNNEEILRLRANGATAQFADPKRVCYHAITSDFEPDSVGWKFWRYFTDKPLLRALNAGTDVIFNSANDLVVDTNSMTQLSDQSNIKFHECFGTNPTVHHCNYFRQKETFQWIRNWLQLPAE